MSNERVPKMYRARKGYVLIGKDNKPTGHDIISDTDPMFRAQLHKLEPTPVGEETPDQDVASSYTPDGSLKSELEVDKRLATEKAERERLKAAKPEKKG